MRTFLGGISRYLVNWHVYPKYFNIALNKNEFMINSMVKSISSPSLTLDNCKIQLEEINIESLEDKKLVLEPLNTESITSLKPKNKLRNNYPEYFYIEKETINVVENDCLKIDNLVKTYLKNIKKIENNKVNINTIKLDRDNIGLWIKLN